MGVVLKVILINSDDIQEIKLTGKEDIHSIRRLGLICQMHGDFTTCMVMCGSGVSIGVIVEHLLVVRIPKVKIQV